MIRRIITDENKLQNVSHIRNMIVETKCNYLLCPLSQENTKDTEKELFERQWKVELVLDANEENVVDYTQQT